jgi:hypothetical protein
MKLTPISRQDLVRRLRSLGWSGPYSGGDSQGFEPFVVQSVQSRLSFARCFRWSRLDSLMA